MFGRIQLSKLDKKIENLFWTILEHPLYSPDLSPCDYYLFGPLKET